MTESELFDVLARLDRLVSSCIAGKMSFEQFLKEYGYPMGEYALDGHEASEEEREILKKYSNQLAPHIAITDQILNQLCSREDAAEPAYRALGRIGPDAARELLIEIAKKYLIIEAI